ncbi:MAG: hypothetical protein ACLRIS_12820 [Flavonifractor plautii]
MPVSQMLRLRTLHPDTAIRVLPWGGASPASLGVSITRAMPSPTRQRLHRLRLRLASPEEASWPARPVALLRIMLRRKRRLHVRFFRYTGSSSAEGRDARIPPRPSATPTEG